MPLVNLTTTSSRPTRANEGVLGVGVAGRLPPVEVQQAISARSWKPHEMPGSIAI